jgi:hypothetical protein
MIGSSGGVDEGWCLDMMVVMPEHASWAPGDQGPQSRARKSSLRYPAGLMADAKPANQTEPERLFISFRKLCRENIPEGTFVHRRLTPEETRHLIEEARRAGTLSGVSAEDLFAPYKKGEKRDHGKLCRVLGEHYGIALSLRDFVISADGEGETHHSIHPLQLAEIGEASRLMVVGCYYTLPEERKKGALDFDIDPESVTFHLFEAIDSKRPS